MSSLSGSREVEVSCVCLEHLALCFFAGPASATHPCSHTAKGVHGGLTSDRDKKSVLLTPPAWELSRKRLVSGIWDDVDIVATFSKPRNVSMI